MTKAGWGVGLFFLVQGCCFTPQPTAADPATDPSVAVAVPTPPPPPPTPPEELAAQRAGMLAEPCLNRFGSEVRQVRSTYLGFVDGEAGPTHPEAIRPYVFAFAAETIPTCRAAVDRMSATPPPIPELDAATAEYIRTLEAAGPVIDEAESYYQRETYRDDGGEGARALHPRLVASLDAFLAASSALHGVVSQIERSALDVRLAALAADPTRRGEFLVERALARANGVVTLADDAEIELADERAQRFRVVLADLAPLAAAIAECQTAVDEMIAAPESATIDTGGSYRNYARDFVAAATLLRRAIETRQEFPDADDATEQVQDVIDAYNQVIDAYNRTRR